MAVNRIKSIGEYLRLMDLPKPEHPLICVIDYSQTTFPEHTEDCSFVFDFYSVVLKRNMGYKFHYGQTTYDFDEGVMSFVAPGQVVRIENSHVENRNCNGYILLFHPDFLWKHSLQKSITQLEYFGYSVNEALFLSDKEEKSIIQIIKDIQQEYHSNIDRFSHDLIITQLELLLKYADRFYHRQFLTRRKPSNLVLTKVEDYLNEYFANDDLLAEKGIPTVQQVAEAVFVSPNYLSTLLKSLIAKNTQTLIQEKLLEKAKEKLSTTHLTVSEIAYELGFEHPQSFSKLFKSKEKMTPVEYRQMFN